MSVCKNFVDRKNKIVEEVNLYNSIQFLENEPEYAKKILDFVNKKEKKIKVKLNEKVLGSGSYGVVYKGTLERKNKEYKVAIKIKKITAYDDKISNENEVKMQEKIYKIKKPNGDTITPRVFLCAFICSGDILSYNSREICEGIQVIIMERKTPMDLYKLKFDSLSEYRKLLVKALKNYDMLVKNGIYMYDIKPENNVIEIQDDGSLNVQVIDADPGFIYDSLEGSFFEKMSKNTFRKIFLTITQMMYVINYNEKLKYALTTKYYKKYLDSLSDDKYISNLLKKFIGYFSVIYNFLMMEDYNNENDMNFSRLFLKYTIYNNYFKTRKSKVKAFIEIVKTMFPIEEKETPDSTIKRRTKKKINIVKNHTVQTKTIPKFTSSRTDS